MTGILRFETSYGPVLVEVDEKVARNAQSADGIAEVMARGYVPKSPSASTTASSGNIVAKAPTSFGEAMTSLRAYAANLQELIGNLDLTPKEVSVEIGLTIAGEAGWIIAKAGTSAEIKIALTWEPGAKHGDRTPTPVPISPS